jgi:hypothetical protein
MRPQNDFVQDDPRFVVATRPQNDFAPDDPHSVAATPTPPPPRGPGVHDRGVRRE